MADRRKPYLERFSESKLRIWKSDLKKKKKVKGRVNYEAKVKRIKGHDIIKESQKARVRRRGADSTRIRKSGRIESIELGSLYYNPCVDLCGKAGISKRS